MSRLFVDICKKCGLPARYFAKFNALYQRDDATKDTHRFAIKPSLNKDFPFVIPV